MTAQGHRQGMSDSISRRVLDEKIAGWDWVGTELRDLRDRARAEADRLLGPDRGE